MKRISRILILVISLFSLSGCIPLLVGGAAGAAAALFVMHDSRNWPTKKTDEQIRKNIAANLALIPAIKNDCHISVVVYERNVLLIGQATTHGLKDKAQEIAAATPEIKKLYNEITIEAPTSQIIRMNDMWLSTKVKTELMTDKMLKDASLLVIVENGNVYVMGQLTPAQSNDLTRKLNKMSGVRKVVKMVTVPKVD